MNSFFSNYLQYPKDFLEWSTLSIATCNDFIKHIDSEFNWSVSVDSTAQLVRVYIHDPLAAKIGLSKIFKRKIMDVPFEDWCSNKTNFEVFNGIERVITIDSLRLMKRHFTDLRKNYIESFPTNLDDPSNFLYLALFKTTNDVSCTVLCNGSGDIIPTILIEEAKTLGRKFFLTYNVDRVYIQLGY
ncbi:hypothetical protein QWY31_01010 [Cytophagales bacterium LB-30]|uniref:Uncharacterized protein n=1 Tax=Shiella aurantiaca TaxID=3058365 RepID=A0ABT8F0T1_9BACT|nr:hypothetical protein [Shiella aurantiaca]MDN4164055.1 hypothetical protein [Shiella aurantiaca]